MSCDELRDLFELYALGVLDRSERAEVEDHLDTGCEACTRALQRAKSLNTAILASVPLTDPPRHLRQRVIAMVANWRLGRPRLAAGWIALAASIALVIWLGVQNRRASSELAAVQQQMQTLDAERQRLDAALTFLRDPETRPAGSGVAPSAPRGTYYLNPNTGVLLIATNLPPLDSGKTYQMWVIPRGQAPRPAGLFRPDARGAAVHFQAGPVDIAATQALAITVEPEGGSPAPTTQPMLVTSAGP